MKSIKHLFCVLAIAGTAFAEPVTPTVSTLPESLPITSKSEVRADAINNVRGGQVSVWGESISWDNSDVTSLYFHPDTRTSPEEVVDVINNVDFRFKVFDKGVPLRAYAELHNSAGFTLFWGEAPVTVALDGTMICENLDLSQIVPFVPIYVGNEVQSAYIRYKDQWIDVDVWNGWLMAPVGYCGKDGMLVLRLANKNVGYSLKTGAVLPTYVVTGTVPVSLGDYSAVNDDGLNQGQIVYVNLTGYVGGKHEAPVASVEINLARQVKFSGIILKDGTNNILEFPKYIWVKNKYSGEKFRILLTPNQWSAGITLPTASSWIVYLDTAIYDDPAPVSSGGGGGKG
jgi:hypothetical protein